MQVLVSTKQFLGHFKTLAALAARRFQSPILETLQLKATPEGRGILHVAGLDADLALEIPLLKVFRSGIIQLPPAASRALQEAKTATIEIVDFAPQMLPFMADPTRPCRRVSLPLATVARRHRDRPGGGRTGRSGR